MYKKQVLSIMLILWFAVQFSFAESVTFKSNSKSEDGNPLVLNGILSCVMLYENGIPRFIRLLFS